MCVEIEITSPETINYNCFAWAAGELNRWWNPDRMGSDYWPSSVTRQESLQAYLEAYQTIGYEICDRYVFEPGFEKIAIYVDDNGKPIHAARQLPNGQWTSKIGMWEDVEHEFSESLVMEIREKIVDYGTIATVMKRPLSNSTVALTL
jgi:hypothetical protein